MQLSAGRHGVFTGCFWFGTSGLRSGRRAFRAWGFGFSTPTVVFSATTIAVAGRSGGGGGAAAAAAAAATVVASALTQHNPHE